MILVMSYVKAQLGGPVAGWLVPVAAANKTMGGAARGLRGPRLAELAGDLPAGAGSDPEPQGREYVEAARALGAGAAHVTGHLVPNTAGTILVAATLGVPNAILLEASLSSVSASIRRLPAGD